MYSGPYRSIWMIWIELFQQMIQHCYTIFGNYFLSACQESGMSMARVNEFGVTCFLNIFCPFVHVCALLTLFQREIYDYAVGRCSVSCLSLRQAWFACSLIRRASTRDALGLFLSPSPVARVSITLLEIDGERTVWRASAIISSRFEEGVASKVVDNSRRMCLACCRRTKHMSSEVSRGVLFYLRRRPSSRSNGNNAHNSPGLFPAFLSARPI